MSNRFDVAIVGGGVVGCALGRQLLIHNGSLSVAIVEKENSLSSHTSGRNSGVIHSGFNQRPGTLKAKFCVEGNRKLRQYCAANSVKFETCGTIVSANTTEESKTLRLLKRRAELNGVPDVHIISQKELLELEPAAAGSEALYSPTGSIVDSKGLVEAMASEAARKGAEIVRSASVFGVERRDRTMTLRTTRGDLQCETMINCAGLHADRVARMVGHSIDYSIVPFRGEYYRLRKNRATLRSMVYPTPNLNFPFLGVHFTKRVNGDVIVGPNAVLATGRESYSVSDVDVGDVVEMFGFPGFLRAALNPTFLRLTLNELYTSISKERFIRCAQRLVPSVGPTDFVKDTAGVRAQLLRRDGQLVEDFLIEWGRSSIHVLNSVSPGMTCSIPFAEYVVEQGAAKGYF